MEEDELKTVIAMKDHSDTIKAITLNVSQMDGVIPSGEKKSLPPAVQKSAPKVAEPQEEVEEPKKVTKKTAAPVEEKGDLSDIVGDWDD